MVIFRPLVSAVSAGFLYEGERARYSEVGPLPWMYCVTRISESWVQIHDSRTHWYAPTWLAHDPKRNVSHRETIVVFRRTVIKSCDGRVVIESPIPDFGTSLRDTHESGDSKSEG